jgi:hypothetical protein
MRKSRVKSRSRKRKSRVKSRSRKRKSRVKSRSRKRKSRVKSRSRKRKSPVSPRPKRLPSNSCVYDAKCAKSKYGGPDLKVTIRKGPKGVSLFASKPINRGNIIAYYKFLVYSEKNFYGQKKSMYVMSVYNKSEKFIPHLIGDIYEGSLEKPKNNISFWAYFSNEPSGKQTANCYLDINTKQNFKNRTTIKAGDTMVYKLIATRRIDPGEEIVWCYGDSYMRGYKANCD